jgi:hypothetical protein
MGETRFPQNKEILHRGGAMEASSQASQSCEICGKENCALFNFNGRPYCWKHYQQVVANQPRQTLQPMGDNPYKQGASKLSTPQVSAVESGEGKGKREVKKEKAIFSSVTDHQKVPHSPEQIAVPAVPIPDPKPPIVPAVPPPPTTESKKGPSMGCLLFFIFAALVGWVLYLANVSKVNDYQTQVSSLQSQISRDSEKLDLYECSGVSQYSLDYSSAETIQASLNEIVTDKTGTVASQDYSEIFSNARVALYKVHTDQYMEEFVIFFAGDLSYSNAVFWVNQSCFISK